MSRIFNALRDAALPNVVAIRGGINSAPELATLIEQRTVGPFQCAAVTANPAAKSRLVSLQSSSSGAERFRVLADHLIHGQQTSRLEIIVVTSATGEEGKSFVASNLAITLAKECKKKTVLVEGNFTTPVLSKMFGLATESGLNSLLSEPDAHNKPIYYLENIGLHLLVAKPVRDSFRLLQSPSLQRLLECLRNSFDCVVIDSPALNAGADANVWCRVADGILLVVHEGKTTKKAIQSGLNGLDNPKLIGVAMNDAPQDAGTD